MSSAIRPNATWLLVGFTLLACNPEQPAPTKTAQKQAAKPVEPKPAAPEPAESETGDEPDSAVTGEAAHSIPFADRTSMGYLLLLPPGSKEPAPPTRAHLRTLVEQAFPDRRSDGELDLLLTLIETEPHETDLAFDPDLEAPTIDQDPASTTGKSAPVVMPAQPELDEAAAKRERERIFDLIGLHIEVVHIGVGDAATIPSSALQDEILARGLTEEQRKTVLGRSWAVLLRADYRNQNAVRGLRLLQTLVRIVAERDDALIHDPDTLETMNAEAFSERRLRATAGNVVDQIAIVPFKDPRDDSLLRLSTRGMRRFGAVDLELDGLPRDPIALQQASDLLAGLALALVKEGEVEATGFAVTVPQEVDVDAELIRQTYSARGYEPKLCADCPGVVSVHLVERPPEEHDPEDHVVARVVAPREQSDAPDYDHPQWVRASLSRLFGTAASAKPLE